MIDCLFVEQIRIASLIASSVGDHVEQMIDRIDELIAHFIHFHAVRPAAGPEVHLYVFDGVGNNLRGGVVLDPRKPTPQAHMVGLLQMRDKLIQKTAICTVV